MANGIPMPTISYRIGNTVITSPFTFPKGTTTVTATASNGVTPDATCSFTVTVVCGPTLTTTLLTGTGTEFKETGKGKLQLFAQPNPSGTHFTLHTLSSSDRPATIRVVDVLGRVIEVRSNVAANGVLTIGHNYRPGVYFVQATQGIQTITLKLVKQAYQ
jgi:hypothetical protein